MKIFTIIATFMLVSACTSTDMSNRLERGMGGIPTTQYSDAQTVEEIRKLRPQAQLPLKIAVMPPHRWQGMSLNERKVIDEWSEELKEIGFIRSLEIVPKSLIPSCGYKSEGSCYLDQSRAAAARLGADAILFLNDSTVTDSYVNPASILNLTIVGMWIIPAHHRESFSVYEAALFDVNNGYLYAVKEGRGQSKTARPFMYVEYDTGQEEARIKALNEVGAKLLESAKEQMEKLTPANSGA